MTSAVRLTSKALVLALLVPWVSLAQDAAAPVEAGCPKRPDLVPFLSGSLVGLAGVGWLAYQGVIPESKDTFFVGAERERSGTKPVATRDVRKLGAPDPKVPLWVFGKADTAACRAEPGNWWAVRMGTGEDRQTYLYAELKVQCELLGPGRLSGTPVALRQKDAPTGCMLHRIGENERSGPGGALPSSLLELVPVRQCELPDCARVWERFGAKWDDGSSVSDLTVSWMDRGGSKNPCDWAVEDLSLLVLKTPAMTAPVALQPGGTYFGTLYDSYGPRFVLSRHLGVMHGYDVAKPRAAPKAVRFASPSEEELKHARRTLSPCKR